MKLSVYHDTHKKLRTQCNTWIALCVLLTLSILLLGLGLLQRREKIILVPPTLHKSFWVQGDQLSKEYLEEMALYLSKLLLDLTPSSLRQNHTILLRYTTPESYGTLKNQFFQEEQEYESLQLSTYFKPSSVHVNPESLTAEVKGTLSRYVAGKEIQTTSETLFLKFANRGSGLLLESARGGDR